MKVYDLPNNLHEKLAYDETSPTFLRWKVGVPTGKHNHFRVKAGDVAGGLNTGDGYIQVGLEGRQYKGHLIVWTLLRGQIPEGFVVDHENGDKAFNRITNLALKTSKGNARNVKKNSRNTSGTTGVNLAVMQNGALHYRAIWHDLTTGKAMSKWFSVARLGLIPAMAAATAFRRKKIDELNFAGAGYTERHGK